MIIFIKEKLKKLDDQTNIEKYRVAVNITENRSTLRLIFLRINTAKFVMLRQLFHFKNVRIIVKDKHAENGHFGHNCRMASRQPL